jgi:hypothetical protein
VLPVFLLGFLKLKLEDFLLCVCYHLDGPVEELVTFLGKVVAKMFEKLVHGIEAHHAGMQMAIH